jgi:predicted dinucleotide-binding enzyme
VTFGIIGAGNIAQSVARQVIKAGHSVLLSNARGVESLAPVVKALGPMASPATVAAVAKEKMVLLAVPWLKVPEVLGSLPSWDGRILIDATNHFVTGPPTFETADLDGRVSSEIIAQLAPGARLVKAFNTLSAAQIAADAREGGGRRVLFLSGDDVAAKKEVGQLFEGVGFMPIDLGDLQTGGRMQQVKGPLAGRNLLQLP